MGIVILIVVIIFFIMLAAFFSGSETAIISVNQLRLKTFAGSGMKAAQASLQLLSRLNRVLAATLVGTNIAIISATSLSALLIVYLTKNSSEWLTIVLTTPLILVFGEIIPKSLFRQKADEYIFFLEKPLRFFCWVLSPLVSLITFISSSALKIFSKRWTTRNLLQAKTSAKERPASGREHSLADVTREELKYLIEESEKEGVLEPRERSIIYRIFAFGKTRLEEVMLTPEKVTALEINSSINDLKELVRKTHFSRFPIYENTIENITGTVNVLDVLYEEKKKISLKEFVRPPFYLSTNLPLDNALLLLQSKRQPMAIVRDADNKVKGIVTIEDLVEEIVGEL